MADAQQPAQPSNWFTEWQQRTPVVCRYMVYITLPISLISGFSGLSKWTALVPWEAIARGQVWRLLTSIIDQGGIFTVLFVGLVLLFQAPAHEYRLGSTLFLYQTFLHAVLINVGFVIVCLLLSLIPDAFFRTFAVVPAQGLWGVIMTQLTVQVLSDPTNSTRFLCCPPIPNRYFPWFLVALLSLISLFPQIDLFLGVALGHLVSAGYTKRLEPSSRKLQDWETSGWVSRIRMARSPGFVYAPTTVLPVGQRDVARESMAATWGAMADQMFNPAGANRDRQGQGQGQGATTGQGRTTGQAGGSGQGDEEGSGGHSFHTIPGRLGPRAGGAGGSGERAQQAHSFPGSGRVLGSTDGPSGGAGAAPSAPGEGGSSLLSSVFGRGAAGAGSSSAYAGGTTTATLAGPNAVDVAERRRQAAAAAEARLRANASRGTREGEPSPRSAASAASQGQGQAQGTADLLGLGAATAAVPAQQASPAPAAPRSGYARAVAAREADSESDRIPLVASAGVSAYEEEVDLDLGTGLRSSSSGAAGRGTGAGYTSPAPAAAAAVGLSSLSSRGVPLSEAARRVSLLVDMGFSRPDAEAALVKAGGDVDAAAEALASQPQHA